MKRALLFFVAVLVNIRTYADTETVTWYKDGTVYDTTTCQTDGDISLPTTPTKRGYNFRGWYVALYDFSTLDYTVSGTQLTNNNAPTWQIRFPYGIIQGQALCSVTSNIYSQPSETEWGRYCWCRVRGLIPSEPNIIHKPTTALPWFYVYDYGNGCNASGLCAGYCANQFNATANLRRIAYGIN